MIVGSTAWIPALGVRGRWVLEPRLDITLGARFGWVASYGESSDTTGDGGSGWQLSFTGAAHYWLYEDVAFFDGIGLALDGAYELSKIGFTGTGERRTFAEDPDLVDARIDDTRARLGLGLLFSL